MNRINREVYISVTDLLYGCRIIAAGRDRTPEDYDWMIEFVLDNYFSNARQTTDYFIRKAGQMRIDESTARELLTYVTKELLLRVQRSFEVIFPNRNYTFVWVTENGTIRLTESTTQSPAEYCMSQVLSPQEPEDAFIPERLRRR